MQILYNMIRGGHWLKSYQIMQNFEDNTKEIKCDPLPNVVRVTQNPSYWGYQSRMIV